MIKKLGIIDSGIGGLSLVEEIKNQKISCEIYYVCDHKNVPYGDKKQSFMLEQMSLMIEKLMEKSIDQILIACNTLTVETISIMRDKYPMVRFFGIEPYINYINHIVEKNRENIALAMTPATLASKRIKILKEKFDKDNKLHLIALPNLALMIEKAYFSTGISENMLKDELREVLALNLDTLILGCTHYPLIKLKLKKILNIDLVDPHVNVINHLRVKGDFNVDQAINSIYFSSELIGDFKLKKIKDFKIK